MVFIVEYIITEALIKLNFELDYFIYSVLTFNSYFF